MKRSSGRIRRGREEPAMRVLLIHHRFPPENLGGSELYVAALARRLSQDHEVMVVHRAADPARPAYDLQERRQGAVRVLSLNNRQRRMPGVESYRDPQVTAAVARVVEDFRPQVMHVHHLDGLSTGLIFEARRRGVAVVITLHDFWMLCPLGQLLDVRLRVCSGPTPGGCLQCVGSRVASSGAGPPQSVAGIVGAFGGRMIPWAKNRMVGRLEEMHEVLRAADVLLSPSCFLRDRMQALGVSGIEVVANGHEALERRPRTGDSAGRIRFGFVGTAIPSKGVHVLAEAFRQLDSDRVSLAIHGPFVRYHGDKDYAARVRKALGSSADDCLRGPFPPDRLSDILAGLDVLVVPSLWEENAPLVIDEAFLARLPVVVSDHGGLAERVREGIDGLRFRPGDAADLARVMQRLVEDVDLRERLGQSPPPVPTMDEHVDALVARYHQAATRFRSRPGRVGVVVVDHARPDDASRAMHSALDPTCDVRGVLVDNGSCSEYRLPVGVTRMQLETNRGYAAGANAGIAVLREAGCGRILMLNNDVVLDAGAVRRLAEALEEPLVAAVGMVILRQEDCRVESQGGHFDPRWGRQRLIGHGDTYVPREGRREVDYLPGAVIMWSAKALDQVGPLDEEYFHSFEDVDWCLRARQRGWKLVVVLGVKAHHVGGGTLAHDSPVRLYYAARNHLRAAERLLPLHGLARWSRRTAIVARNLAHVMFQGKVPRMAGLKAVLLGVADSGRGRFGPRARG